MNRIQVVVGSCASLAVIGTSEVYGGYVVTALSGGSDHVTLAAGRVFSVDVSLTSDALDVCNSGVFRVVFSKPGLLYESYAWSSPFVTGSIFDQSKPGWSGLPGPIDAATLVGPGYPADVVDIELANASAGVFSTGVLTTLSLQIPETFSLGDFHISIVPDTFAIGLDTISTTAGGELTVSVVPAPGAISILICSFATVTRGRRRRG